MSERIRVATRKGLFTVDRKGAPDAWEIVKADFVGDPVTMVLRDPRETTLYAALNLGHFGAKLRRSGDDGATWEECGVPQYPAAGNGDGGRRAGNGGDVVGDAKPEGPSLHQIWALETGGEDEPGTLWAGTIPGGLFASHDRGTSWQLNRALWDRPERLKWFGGGYDQPGIHSVSVDPRDSRRIGVGVSCGGVWITEDRGETWTCSTRGMWAAYMPPDQKDTPEIQDPHRLARCRSFPDVFWVQHHNGVFRSTDGAANWKEVENVPPSNFGFAVAVHPSEPATAWLVPGVKDECRVPVDGKLVVARTRDGGETFDVLRDGLPQQHAYDLVYRHALDVDVTGDVLAMGSTTGGLWISEDQGDHWHTVTTHLPPVYCVRFD